MRIGCCLSGGRGDVDDMTRREELLEMSVVCERMESDKEMA